MLWSAFSNCSFRYLAISQTIRIYTIYFDRLRLSQSFIQSDRVGIIADVYNVLLRGARCFASLPTNCYAFMVLLLITVLKQLD